jgi:hypothetical protein
VIVQGSEIKVVDVNAAGDEPFPLRLLDDKNAPLLKGREERANLTRPYASTQNVLIVRFGEERGVPEGTIVAVESIDHSVGPFGL